MSGSQQFARCATGKTWAASRIQVLDLNAINI